jgi:hypothetical protein
MREEVARAASAEGRGPAPGATVTLRAEGDGSGDAADLGLGAALEEVHDDGAVRLGVFDGSVRAGAGGEEDGVGRFDGEELVGHAFIVTETTACRLAATGDDRQRQGRACIRPCATGEGDGHHPSIRRADLRRS